MLWEGHPMDADELGRVHISSAGAAKVVGGQLPADQSRVTTARMMGGTLSSVVDLGC